MMTRAQKIMRRNYTNRVRTAAGLGKITTPISMKRGKKLSAATKQRIARGVKLANRKRKSQNIKKGQIQRTKLFKELKASKSKVKKRPA